MNLIAARVWYGYECNGLVNAIQKASDRCRWHGPDPGLDYMDLTDQAIWLTRYIVRRARLLGLYDDTCEKGRRHVA